MFINLLILKGLKKLVRTNGLEPLHLSAYAPQTSFYSPVDELVNALNLIISNTFQEFKRVFI